MFLTNIQQIKYSDEDVNSTASVPVFSTLLKIHVAVTNPIPATGAKTF
jgi:hypothetical protein